MPNKHKEKQRIKNAEIPADAVFTPIKDGWDIEHYSYPSGWSWVRRFDEPQIETGELKEVVKTRPLLGWGILRNRETGESVIVGITADAETDAPYPACDADGFEGYVREPAGMYLEGGPNDDVSDDVRLG